MDAGWGSGVTRWWRGLAPSFAREVLAQAILGRQARATELLPRLMARDGIVARTPQEQRTVATIVIGDPAGEHLPVAERVALARAASRLPWPELTHCLRTIRPGTDAELDRLLAEAGASVADRLSVWGLGAARTSAQR